MVLSIAPGSQNGRASYWQLSRATHSSAAILHWRSTCSPTRILPQVPSLTSLSLGERHDDDGWILFASFRYLVS